MNVTKLLDSHKVAYKVYEHAEVNDAQHLAAALHIPGHNVAKSVMLCVNHGFEDVIVVLPATEQVDLDRVSSLLGGATVWLANEAEIARRCPDCEVGSLPPFGRQYGMRIIVDESLARHEDLFFASNNRRESIRLAYDDFCMLEHPLVANVAKRRPHAATPSVALSG